MRTHQEDFLPFTSHPTTGDMLNEGIFFLSVLPLLSGFIHGEFFQDTFFFRIFRPLYSIILISIFDKYMNVFY